jgi:DNA-binding MurR/RpiR family transcriptional regulator
MIPLGGFSVPEEFASIRPTDAVLALAIGRRTRTLRSILQSAMLAGAQTISLTDQASAGNRELAHVTLRCRTNGLSYFDSLAAPVSVITYLCMAVANRVGQAAFERLRYIDSIHTEWGDPG